MGQREKKNRVGWAMKNGFLTFKSLRSGSQMKMKRKKERKKKLEKKALGGKKGGKRRIGGNFVQQ